MKEWYDGYHFGDVDVYCPWDVINRCDLLWVSKDAPMRPHWENSSNAIVKSESGTGYSDILLMAPRERIGCVIEVKYAEDTAFDAACREAMEQIETHEYTELLRSEGMETIHKYGLACFRKSCRVTYERE